MYEFLIADDDIDAIERVALCRPDVEIVLKALIAKMIDAGYGEFEIAMTLADVAEEHVIGLAKTYRAENLAPTLSLRLVE